MTVIEQLRAALESSVVGVVPVVWARLYELSHGTLEGRAIHAKDVAALQAEIVAFCRDEALPALGESQYHGPLALFETLKTFGLVHLELDRLKLLARLRERFPVPVPSQLPELEAVIALPGAVLAPPIAHLGFAAGLAEDGLSLPDEVLALYAACDGFTLAGSRPVFELLDSERVEVQGDRRVSVFSDGADGLMSLFFADTWQLAYADATKRFELAPLLRFAIGRAQDDAHSWASYFARR